MDGARSRPVRRLLVSHALASVAMSMPWPLFLVLVWDQVESRPHGVLLLGLTGAARMAPYVLLSWATGMLADRWRRDRLLRATVVARVALLAASALAVALDDLTAAVLTAALAVACGTPAYPALAAAIPEVAGADRRRATELLVTIEVASFVVGPAVGGLLLGSATRPWLPTLAVALAVLAAVPLVGVHLPPVSRPALHPGPVPARSGSLGVLRGSSAATRAVLLAGLLNAVDAALLLALVPLAEDLWRSGESGYGVACGVLGFGALAAPALWRLGSSTAARARLGLLLLAGALIAVVLVPGIGWALLPLVVAGAATVHVEGAVTEAIQDAVPDAHRAGMLGLTDSVMVGAALLSSLAAPWFSALLGPRLLVALLACSCVGGLALLVRPRGPARAAGGAPAGAGPIPRQRAPSRLADGTLSEQASAPAQGPGAGPGPRARPPARRSS